MCAALLLCAAAATAVNQLTPTNQFTARVIVAARDLPAGGKLRAEDLQLRMLPPAAIPQAALTDPAQATGQLLTGAVRSGQVLSDTSILGPGLLTGSPPGSVAVPLHIADPQTISWLRPGQLVNVLLSSPDALGNYQPGKLLARGIPVLWLPSQQQDTTGGLLVGSANASDTAKGLVLVTASAAQSTLLSGAASRGKLSLVLTAG
ncbi:hypothetical protein UM93_09145 [Psychromicrobium lacuslunae]|uniref:SAF domain-containing protein n=1 Tax=Psychromicrobium lacuslunae TaxID=1618207 RepID=A0A0D4C2Y1_9MICC|nr:hypothetical protein UM93_09145 [Psychromicrobium lacuslunae]